MFAIRSLKRTDPCWRLSKWIIEKRRNNATIERCGFESHFLTNRKNMNYSEVKIFLSFWYVTKSIYLFALFRSNYLSQLTDQSPLWRFMGSVSAANVSCQRNVVWPHKSDLSSRRVCVSTNSTTCLCNNFHQLARKILRKLILFRRTCCVCRL